MGSQVDAEVNVQWSVHTGAATDEKQWNSSRIHTHRLLLTMRVGTTRVPGKLSVDRFPS